MTESGANLLDVNEDLEAQLSLADHLMERIVETAGASYPRGVGDSESFWYANDIHAETLRKIARLEGHDTEPAMATGDALRAYIDETWAGSDSKLDEFRKNVGTLLAGRLDGSPNGMVPLGYVMASQLLRHDCEVSGKDGFTGEPMPETVTGFPAPMYAMFFNIEAVHMAREVFGGQFADEVEAIYADVFKTGEKPDEQVLSTKESFEDGPDALYPIERATDVYQAVGIWWAKALLSPSFGNGADNEANASAQMLVETLAPRSANDAVTAKVGRFARELERLSREREVYRVSVDYDPDMTLRDAAEAAGMPVNGIITFPWKTSTWIEDGVVTASAGYGNPAEQVWPPIDAEQAA